MPAKILLRKTSLVDYPGRVSSVFFFAGCNLRCPWCHNRELVTGEAEGFVSAGEALAHVRKRRSVLGGVVLSGGEPCLCEDLPDIISEIKNLALPVKLDTNGTFPAMLEKLISREETRPDYIALDLKIAPKRYAELLPGPRSIAAPMTRDSAPESRGGFNPGEALIKSAELLREADIARECRTLALPGGHITEKDIAALAPLAAGAPWHIRPFKGGNCLDPAWDSMEDSPPCLSRHLEQIMNK